MGVQERYEDYGVNKIKKQWLKAQKNNNLKKNCNKRKRECL